VPLRIVDRDARLKDQAARSLIFDGAGYKPLYYGVNRDLTSNPN
jgi:hypothetical protein